VAPGANEQLSVADVLAATDAIAGAQVLLVQLEVPVPTVMAALRLARQAGVLTVLDAAPPVPLDDDFLGLVDVLRANAAAALATTRFGAQVSLPRRDKVEAFLEETS
jgi:ribokinase